MRKKQTQRGRREERDCTCTISEGVTVTFSDTRHPQQALDDATKRWGRQHNKREAEKERKP